MSQCRKIVPNEATEKAELLASLDWVSTLWNATIKAMIVGPMVGTALHFVDKCIINTHVSNGKPVNFKTVITTNPLGGYGAGMAHSISKTFCLFLLKPVFEKEFAQQYPDLRIGKQLASGLAGLASSYLTNYTSVRKTWGHLNTPKESIKNIKFKDQLFKGAHATALRDGVFFMTYFSLFDWLQTKTNHAALDGAVAGLLASLVANPLAVIATLQKETKEPITPSICQTSCTLFNKAGVKGFYKNVLSTSALRMTIQGFMIGYSIELADKIMKNTDVLADEQNEAQTLSSRKTP